MRAAGIPASAIILCRALALALLFLLGALPVAPAGQQQQNTPGPFNQRTRGPFDSVVEPDPVVVERQTKALNVVRQKSLVADADRLLNLARELNTEIAADESGTLTPVQQRKLAEIGKLAHSVKSKMRDASFGPPSLHETNSIPYER